MKKWTIGLLCALVVVAAPFAQTKPGAKASDPVKPTTVVPAPEPVKPVETPRPSPSSATKLGAIGLRFGFEANWMTQAPSVGVSYYLEPGLELQTLTTLSLTGSTVKDNIASSTQDQSAPSLTLLVAGMFETKLSPQAAWSWGPLVGFQVAGGETKLGTKENTGNFDLILGGSVMAKYYFIPQIALYGNLQLALDWTLSSTDVITNAAGTKTKDNSASGYSLTTQTSNLGIIFYLN